MKNEFLDIIETRRSVRSYKPDAVPTELLDTVLKAGTFAPTGKGQQSPVIVAVTDERYRKILTQMNDKVLGSNSDPYYGAPVIVLVLANGSVPTFVEDGSCVLQNMMLAAHALGLASVWVNRERQMFDSDEGKALLQEWGLPSSLRGVGALALGYAAGPAKPPIPRKNGYIVKI